MYICILGFLYRKSMKIIIFIICCFWGVFAYSQTFEGTIDIVKTTLSDTLYYSYTIKNNHIRIDEYDKHKRLQKSFILNLQDSSIFALNPHDKLYMPVERQIAMENAIEPTIIHTGNFKYINGYRCYQWRVRDVASNTEIAYWVAQENFDFFVPMAHLWKTIEENFSFFTLLPLQSIAGNMPLLTETRTLLRDEKAIISVINIERVLVSDALFVIPHTYNIHQIYR